MKNNDKVLVTVDCRNTQPICSFQFIYKNVFLSIQVPKRSDFLFIQLIYARKITIASFK